MKDKKFFMEMEMETSTIDIMLSLIRSLTTDEMIEFVKDIDYEMQDWEFTEKMFEYFDDVMKEHPDNDM